MYIPRCSSLPPHSVLVETFEEGVLISRDVNQTQPPPQHQQKQQPEAGNTPAAVAMVSAGGASARSLSSASASAPSSSGVEGLSGSRRRTLLAETGLNLYLQVSAPPYPPSSHHTSILPPPHVPLPLHPTLHPLLPTLHLLHYLCPQMLLTDNFCHADLHPGRVWGGAGGGARGKYETGQEVGVGVKS